METEQLNKRLVELKEKRKEVKEEIRDIKNELIVEEKWTDGDTKTFILIFILCFVYVTYVEFFV